jgi:thioredoxin reductase (NADPH)
MPRPVLLAVDGDPVAMSSLERELHRRYRADYQVPCAGSGTAGLQVLEQVKKGGGQLALADLRLPDMTGIELLAEVHGLDRAAKRALLTGWGDRLVGDRLVQAAVLGQVDGWGLKPWQPGDEGFHRLVVGLLYEWAQLHRPGFQAVQVVGERWSARAHELRDLLARNKVLCGFLPADSQEGRGLLGRVGATAEQLPVVVTFDGLVLANPTLVEVAEALSAPTRPAAAAYDVTVVGAGPAGLAAAVYGASEGLGTVVLEPEATGGQAGTSSMIRNYLGFPRGISGTELAYRAFHQAIGFGAGIVYGRRAVGLRAARSDRVVTLGDGTGVTSRAVVLATGVTWRRLGVASLEALVGAGVFYGAAASEAQAMRGQQVFVLIGAEPPTGWLPEAIQRDRWGFVVTGTDLLGGAGRPPAGWPLERPPMPFETSLPGVFAIGDVRHGSIKRVASAVGEGSAAIWTIHQYLSHQESPSRPRPGGESAT